MRVAKYADGEPTIIYGIDVKQILAMLDANKLATMRDPTGVGGNISPCKTEALKQDALSKLNTAATRAGKARIAEENGDIKTAFDCWRLLYNDKFPTYYL